MRTKRKIRDNSGSVRLRSIQQALRDMETILDSIADGVFTVNLDYNITYFNRAAEKITGVRREEAIGKKCFDVLRANACHRGCPLKKTFETGKENRDVHVDIMNSTGKLVPLSIATALLRDKDSGKVIGGVETFRDISPIEELKKELTKKYTFGDIITKSHKVLKIIEVLPDIARSDSCVVIEGESGTGKEVFARTIHALSSRKDRAFVPVNCAALPETLLESELFGYVKGAFTGADSDKKGRFALAEGGTLLLDEIGEVSPAIQVKLLRVLQEGEYDPLGTTKTVKANVRVIATTNKSLLELVRKGKFRQDLYYRLNVVKLILPPLRQRREDIPLLVDYFVKKFSLKKGKNIKGVSRKVMEFFMKYDFPGNIRELENIIERGFALCHGEVIDERCFPDGIIEANEIDEGVLNNQSALEESGGISLHDMEKHAIMEALRRFNWSRKKTAASLGIDVSTLWRKMKKYGIKKEKQ